MQYQNIESNNTKLAISSFAKGSTEEIHLMCAHKGNAHFDQQLDEVIESIESYITQNEIAQEAPLLFRLFLSDCANQAAKVKSTSELLNKTHKGCAISVVQQPPLNGSKVTVWAYLLNTKTPVVKTSDKEALQIEHGAYKHIYHTQLLAEDNSKDSLGQTDEIFKTFDDDLVKRDITMKENCIRTWIYVKDVDYNYEGVVVGRRNLFEKLDMTVDTHYITSTGIEGRHFDYKHSVLMDAYSIAGINPEQVKFLTATDYLNPTHEYGVTFERGTSVDFGDRRHIYLSGTASIDNKGEVVHPHQIDKQIERTLINVEALLNDAEAKMDDIAQLIIYLRDVGDTKIVNDYFAEHHIDIPKVIVLAPVCRPGWLIEMECIAIKSIDNANYDVF